MPSRTDPLIYVRNESRGVVKDEDLARIIPAVQRQVSEHFRPVWGVGAQLVLADGRAPRHAYQINVYDKARSKDDEDYLGYHYSPNGYPVTSIFAKDDIAKDGNISVTLSHEVLEMIVDPACNLYANRSAGVGRPQRIYFYEVCDAVQCQHYKINGVEVCDFIYPEWFEDNWPARSRRFDHLGLIEAPFQILPGCYADVYEAKRGSITVWGSKKVKNRGHHRFDARKHMNMASNGGGRGAKKR